MLNCSYFLDEQVKITINGVQQYLSMRAEYKNSPLLLYLHGGPGDAALPLVMKYNHALEEFFTVVIWEQRGTGKSYYRFQDDDHITISLFEQDLLELIQYLLNRFQQEKLFLVGHSWGSVLGLRFISCYPQYVKTYVGCGQVVNMRKSCRIAYDYALEHADQNTRKKLQVMDCSYSGEGWLKDLLFITKQVVKHKGSLFGKCNYNSLIEPFLLSKYYGISDLIKRQKGSIQSIRALWPELMSVNFEDVIQYEIPIVFVEGRYDSHVSSALAKQYYDKIQTEKKFVWFERSCHFPQWSESNRFNQLLINLGR